MGTLKIYCRRYLYGGYPFSLGKMDERKERGEERENVETRSRFFQGGLVVALEAELGNILQFSIITYTHTYFNILHYYVTVRTTSYI